MTGTGPTSVLVAAGGAEWEVTALQRLAAGAPRVVLLKRCVDLHDLLASAATREGQVALLTHDLPGLDADSVDHLRRAGLAVVMVAAGPPEAVGEVGERAQRLGVDRVLGGDAMADLVETVVQAGADTQPGTGPEGTPDPLRAVERPHARTLAVWGPTGAPGRTTLAVAIAADLAHRGFGTFLADIDGHGGAVAQHLGVLDEISGLLAAARLANSGQLDRDRLAGVARQVSPSLSVLTGLPRADRWPEVRDAAFGQVLDLARSMADYLVLDTSFNLEADPAAAYGSPAPQRNGMTLAGLEAADEVVVVGSADPVGLTRLARGLVDLLEVVPGHAVRVVVNRNRPALAWGQKEVRTMIEGFVSPSGVHFLPEDRAAADRALMSGRSLVELGESPLRRAVGDIVDAITGVPATRRSGRRIFSRSR